MFINLINHSSYSLMSSLLSIDDIISFSLINKQQYASLIDINTLHGAMEFYTKCQKNNLIPILGLQIVYQNHKYVLVPHNYEALKKIYKVSSLINLNKDYVLIDLLDNVSVIALDNFINQGIKSKCLNYYTVTSDNPIAVKENFCLNIADTSGLKILECLRESKLLANCKTNYSNAHMFNESEANNFFTQAALNNLNRLLATIKITIVDEKINFINYSNDSSNLLISMATEKLKLRLNNKIIPQIYLTRLENELSVINNMNFANYFLVVQDYVNWAKLNNILVGPGRGSGAGSLVAYSLGITDIDPLKYNLIFERFLNAQRKSMPDFDIDFEDDKREQVIDYIFNKYQKNHVCHIITFQRNKIKAAIRDVARILEIDLKIVDGICKLFSTYDDNIDVLITTNNDIKKIVEKYQELFVNVRKIINIPRQCGIHAAGLVICGSELINTIPITYVNDHIATQFSMEWLERLGLIKIDILGLSNLSLLSSVVSLVKKNQIRDISLVNVSLEDDIVYKYFAKGDTIGIFQFGSNGMRRLLKRMRPKSINDISLCLALYRPGPLKNIDTFIDNRYHPIQIKYLDSKFIPILNDTSGIIVYQEQLIEIIKIVCNYSYAQADIFRAIISKKQIDKLNDLKTQFIVDARKNNYSQEQAEKIFSYIESFAEYGFNRSHAISYAMLSYWEMYLKINYPYEFFCVLLSKNASDFKGLSEHIADAKNHCIKINKPSLFHSKAIFNIVDQQIYYSFNAIKGIGDETAKQIEALLNQYVKYDLIHLIMFLSKNKLTKSIIEKLLLAGTFDSIFEKDHDVFYYLFNLDEIIKSAISLLPSGEVIIEPDFRDPTFSQAEKNNYLKIKKDLLPEGL